MRWPTARRGGRRAAAGTAVVALALLVTGCGDSGYTPSGPFRPLPQGQPPEVGPPSVTAPAPAPAPSRPSPQSGQQQTGDPNVVASNLAVPTGLVVLPDGSAIVGERATGRLLQVFADRSPAKVLMTVPGIDAGGDGGLLGLAVSPSYDQDGLLYAYVSTPSDNRIVRFPIGGTPNPVVTGIPHGTSRNGGGLYFAGDGTLFIGTGDTGVAALAQNPASMAGKVLHVDVFGHPAADGPVYAQGLGDVTALCVSGDQKLYATDVTANGADELDQLATGADYGFPSGDPAAEAPAATLPAGQGGLGGCAFTGRSAFLGALDGQRIDIVALDEQGTLTGKITDVLAGRYGRLRSVAVDSDGALWITTSNRDGIGTPAADDDKVLRIVPPTSSGNSPL